MEYHHDKKSKFRFAHDTADDVWLPKVAAEGWVVFSHDRKFHELLPELSAVKQYKAACFYLPGASSPVWYKLQYFICGFEGIKNRIATNKAPFIFNLSVAGRFTRVKIPL